MRVPPPTFSRIARACCLGAAFVMSACSPTPDASSEQLGSVSSADTAAWGADDPTPSSSSRSVVQIRWAESETAARPAAAPAILQVTNSDAVDHDVRVTLQLWGLHAHRVQELGTVHVAAHGSAAVTWLAATSPIAPVQGVVRLLPQARFDSDTRRIVVPGDLRFATFTPNLAELSLRRGASPVGASPIDHQGLGRRRGRLDGSLVDDASGAKLATVSPTPVPVAEATSWLDAEDGDIGETTASPGSLDAPIAPVGEASPSAPQALASTTVYPCRYRSGPIITWEPYTTAPVCSKWRPYGYRDVGIYDDAIPTETFNAYLSPAAYANATVYRDGVAIWSGRTDSTGCTPAVQFCRATPGLTMSISPASIQKPPIYSPWFYIPGSRELRVQPETTFTTAVSLSSSTQTGAILANANVWASTEDEDRILRVASIASRLLTVADNGVADSDTRPVYLPLITNNGCMQYYDASGVRRLGEACGNGTSVVFGESLSYVSGLTDAKGVPIGEPTGTHTTADAFTIAHEIGHAVAGDAAIPLGNAYAAPASGDCSCAHVVDGNRVHCLQSRDQLVTTFAEGWAHFVATRTMNDKGSTARFTYYKDALRKNFVGATLVFAPPFPVRASAPHTDPLTGETGWARTYCPAPTTSSEQDWLTFLWALNGANTSGQIDMPGLFSVFGDPSVKIQDPKTHAYTNFTWEALAARSGTAFGLGSPRALTFVEAGVLHGVAQ